MAGRALLVYSRRGRSHDHLGWSRRIPREFLKVEPIEFLGGHCPNVSQPSALADVLGQLAQPAKIQMENISREIHSDLPREGPGNCESTVKAYSMLSDVPARPTILDIGCGPGMQTIDLAKVSGGNITAFDRHKPFLDELMRRADKEGVASQIQPVLGSMFKIDFPDRSFDVIWAEGAIYIKGLENGLRDWRILLKENGYLAVTELSWLTEEKPKIPKDFWARNYPKMKTIDQNLAIITECDYRMVGHFVLPESAWWDDYYKPMEQRLEELRKLYQNKPELIDQLDESRAEIELFRAYHDYYGYVFYVTQEA